MKSTVHENAAKILTILTLLPTIIFAQVNSGSNGSDGTFNPATNVVIDMHDHPNGIYQYTSVNISNGVTITFVPNANNTPLTWLVQSNCEIDGTVAVSGQNPNNQVGGAGGPGGWLGGSSGSNPSAGEGPGGGSNGGGGGGFGVSGTEPGDVGPWGQAYGNSFLLPLMGGSGGGGRPGGASGGGGGGGAILVAASSTILNGTINARGGSTVGDVYGSGGPGSGGGVRIVAQNFSGVGMIDASGGTGASLGAGLGRVRIDSFQNSFGGQINGAFTQGFQPVIVPVTGQGIQLNIVSIGGAIVSATPSGQSVTPDAIISGQQPNPISVVVNCLNLPLNTPITITVNPVNGSPVSAIGYNANGSEASSTATISLNMPHGGGIIYATAATGN